MKKKVKQSCGIKGGGGGRRASEKEKVKRIEIKREEEGECLGDRRKKQVYS